MKRLLKEIQSYQQKTSVWISNPVSINEAYATFMGRRISTEKGRKYEGEWKLVPKTKPYQPKHGEVVVNQKEVKSGKNKGRKKVFIEGAVGKAFRSAGLPTFAEGVKVVINAWATWPDKRARDMSNFQKLIEDAMQNGKFIPNDSHILYRNKNFEVKAGVFGLKLEIYELKEEL